MPPDTKAQVRQYRLDGSPLLVGEFVRHDASLRFQGSNYGSVFSLNMLCQALFMRYRASAISQSRNAFTLGRRRARWGQTT